MKNILILIIWGLLIPLTALNIIDIDGVVHEFSYDYFFKIQAQEFSTFKEVDKEIVENTWKGIRFDTWLAEQKFKDFANIRFVSNDRYEVKFNKAEWDTLTCYLAHTSEGKLFPKEQLRIIFPHIRSMHWVRDVQQVFLENYKEVPIPIKFLPLKNFFATQELVENPKPFVHMNGYCFDDFIFALSDLPIKDVLIYSRDGLVQNLRYPSQLAGAVLELTESGTYNLKSPQIPGGMWMKDIRYLQVDYQALIDINNPSLLIPLAKSLEWQLTTNVMLKLQYRDNILETALGEVLAEPMILDEVQYFELIP